jgi:tetratricopeptide (TPR) repeat protein
MPSWSAWISSVSICVVSKADGAPPRSPVPTSVSDIDATAAAVPSIEQCLEPHRAGRLEEAAALYGRRLAHRPEDPEALHLLGLVREQQGASPEAARLIERACALAPRAPLFRANLAVVLRSAAPTADAVEAARAAVALQPGSPEFHFTLATMLENDGRPRDAEASYRAALERRPDHADSAYNLARLLHKREAIAESVPYYRVALASRPDFINALMNLAAALGSLGEIEDGTGLLARARALAPDNLNVIATQGLLAVNRGDLAEATAILDRLAQASLDAGLAHRLGTLARNAGRFADAITYFRRLLVLEPGNSDARLTVALMQLTMGRFAEAWPAYRARWQLESHVHLARRYPAPAWSGENFAGRTLLVYPEQGLGDIIQFARYLPLTAARGGQVLFLCPPPLLRLFQPFHETITIVPQSPTPPPHDLTVPLMDLPILFDTGLSTIPPLLANLAADPAFVASWAPKVDRLARPRIGLVWRGNPGFSNDRNRSMKLAQLRPLIDGADASFVSLQKGPSVAEIAENGWQDRILDLGSQLEDFADTAAVMAGLDLIVTVDTAVAHLAGSLNRPVWILIPFVPDWRWLLDRSDSPWYPTARLFRQTRPGDWTAPVADMLAALSHPGSPEAETAGG